MLKVAVIGECMIEIYNKKKRLYKQTFAGDTFNCAVYLKRVLKKSLVEYITVVGKDEKSLQMLEFINQQKIETSFVDKLQDKTVGLYMITTHEGERSFLYYRGSSAAKKLFLTDSLDKLKEELLKFDMIYFSLITLAIMSEKGRENLFKILKIARKKGVKVAFDSNYRPRLHDSIDSARKMYSEALKNCDVFLPSFDDEKELWGDVTIDSIVKKARGFGTKETVIKCGKEDIAYSSGSEIERIKTKQLETIVDSTSAGDSFNGAYLASRLKGKSIEESIKKAKKVAARVIMYKGAIIPKKKKKKNE